MYLKIENLSESIVNKEELVSFCQKVKIVEIQKLE